MDKIAITLNGEKIKISQNTTVDALIKSLGYKHNNIAVEIDGSLCQRSLYSTALIKSNMKIEIVSFVGGG